VSIRVGNFTIYVADKIHKIHNKIGFNKLIFFKELYGERATYFFNTKSVYAILKKVKKLVNSLFMITLLNR
jgi:hypothetical protein